MIESKRKKYFIIYNILSLLLLTNFIIFPATIVKSSNIKIKNQKPITPFNDGTIIEQEFVSIDNYDSFAIFFATYNYIFKDGNIRIDLLDRNNNKHCKKNIYATSLTDTGPSTIKCSLKEGNRYSLKITTEEIPKSHKITLYSTFYDNNDYKLLINSKEQKGNLIIYYYKNLKSYSNLFYIILLIVIDIIVYPFIFSSRKRVNVDEK